MRCLKSSLSASTEHSSKEKAKERDREEREKKKFKDREKEEKKKHKVVTDIKRENGEVKQPIKGRWKRAGLRESHGRLQRGSLVRKTYSMLSQRGSLRQGGGLSW